MTTTRTRFALVAGALALALALPRAANAAEAFYGVAGGSTLVTFHSDSPGAVRTAIPITGLAPGEQVLALDLRPATGQLYALGSSSRLYVVSPVSGLARALGDPFTPPLAGTHFGFDFAADADRARVVSDGRQNLRLNPDNGAVAAQDQPLDYAADDEAAGANPQVAAAAYTSDGARLLGIDAARDALLAIDPPNAGQLRTIGPLGRDLAQPTSFDIAADATGYVSGRAGGGPVSLFRVDADTGTLAPAARRAALSGAHGEVGAITATGPVADDDSKPRAVFAIDRHHKRARLGRPLRLQASCDEACTIVARAAADGRRVGAGSAALDAAGRTTVRLEPGAGTARLARSGGRTVATLKLRAIDAAGNRAKSRRTLVFE